MVDLFCPSVALDDEDVWVDVLHLQPAAKRQSCVRKHPVHQSSQLQQKRNNQKSKRIDQFVTQPITKIHFQFQSLTSSFKASFPVSKPHFLFQSLTSSFKVHILFQSFTTSFPNQSIQQISRPAVIVSPLAQHKYSLRHTVHSFMLPCKDDKDFISRVLLRHCSQLI